jgi:hypothetical protein
MTVEVPNTHSCVNGCAADTPTQVLAATNTYPPKASHSAQSIGAV